MRGSWPGRLAGGDETLPGQPRAEAIGAQEGVEAAPGAHLAAAQRDVDLARAAVPGGGVLDVVDEARQRALDARRRSARPNGPSSGRA